MPYNILTYKMQIRKRDGQLEPVSFDKVLLRLQNLCVEKPGQSALTHVNCEEISKKVIAGIYDGVATSALDEIAANTAFPLAFEDPEYDILAKRIIVSNYHKNNIYLLYNHFVYKLTQQIKQSEAANSQAASANSLDESAKKELSDLQTNGTNAIISRLYYWVCRVLFENTDDNDNQAPLISPDVFAVVDKLGDALESRFDYNADYNYAYMGFRILESNYLMKAKLYTATGEQLRVPVERPQHLLMRVALGLWCTNTPGLSSRINHAKIWHAIQHAARTYLPPMTFNRYAAAITTATPINWKEFAALMRSHRASTKVLTQLDQAIVENTLTWNDIYILAKNSSTNMDMDLIFDIYELSREMKFTHATPTLFNAGTLRSQNSSCFLLTVPEDSIEGITEYWRRVSLISKWAGGVGSSMHNIRPADSYIRGTNGHSNGHVPMLKVVDDVSRYVDQGGGKRAGSHAIYFEPWTSDIEAVLLLKRPRSEDGKPTSQLFFGMWIPDEFMRCVEAGKSWYLMDPDISIGLAETYDEAFSTKWLTDEEAQVLNSINEPKFAFTSLYRRYIREGKYTRVISAADLWRQICTTIEETGTPYICFKDAGNRKSNQQNLGVIKSSNLCTEIFEFSAADEVAVCNLASICLPKFISAAPAIPDGEVESALPTYFNVSLSGSAVYVKFDWSELQHIVRILVLNLDRLIDINFYPIQEAQMSNQRHRPMGIGVQGWADLCSALRLPFAGEAAARLNFYIFECMYWTALDASAEIAYVKGAYDTFAGSPLAAGVFSHELWQFEQGQKALQYPLKFDWEELRTKILKNGIRNSLLIALMPTVSTSSIMGFSPCFEPHNALVYKRKNKAGEFGLANTAFIKDMQSLKLWTPEIRAQVLQSREGGISDIWEIPQHIRDIYPTAWDIDPKSLIDTTLVRDPFIDQSSSFNWFIRKPTTALLTQLHFYGWRRGKKTSSYYIHRLAPADAQKIGIGNTANIAANATTTSDAVCLTDTNGKRSCCDA